MKTQEDILLGASAALRLGGPPALHEFLKGLVTLEGLKAEPANAIRRAVMQQFINESLLEGTRKYIGVRDTPAVRAVMRREALVAIESFRREGFEVGPEKLISSALGEYGENLSPGLRKRDPPDNSG